MFQIRPACVDDAAAVAQVYVDGWRSAYPGLLPDGLLVRMRASEQRRQAWARLIARSRSPESVIVAETVGEDEVCKVVGFASGGRPRPGSLGYDGEVSTLYVDDDYCGLGLGRRLFVTLAAGLAGWCGPSVIVWVLDRNPARFFYETLGGRWVGRRPGMLGGADIVEIGYGWPDAHVLAARQD